MNLYKGVCRHIIRQKWIRLLCLNKIQTTYHSHIHTEFHCSVCVCVCDSVCDTPCVSVFCGTKCSNQYNIPCLMMGYCWLVNWLTNNWKWKLCQSLLALCWVLLATVTIDLLVKCVSRRGDKGTMQCGRRQAQSHQWLQVWQLRTAVVRNHG